MGTGFPGSSEDAMTTNMPLTITLRQPWPFAVLVLGKRRENRSWRPRVPVGSALFLHGGKVPSEPLDGWNDLLLDFRAIMSRSDDALSIAGLLKSLTPRSVCRVLARCSGIVGTFVYDGAYDGDGPHPGMDGWHEGELAWRLADVWRFAEPIPCRGQQGLWTPDAEVAAAAKQRAVVPCQDVPDFDTVKATIEQWLRED